MHRWSIIGICLWVFYVSCNQSPDSTCSDASVGYKETIRYAEYLSIQQKEDSFRLRIAVDNGQWQTIFEGVEPEMTPNKWVVFSTVFAGFLNALGLTQHIIAVDDTRLYYDSQLRKAIHEHKVSGLGYHLGGAIEKIWALKPDVVVHHQVSEKEMKGLQKKQIRVLECRNYLESHPLGRAEWIKAFALLGGVWDNGCRYFDIIDAQYVFWKNQVSHVNDSTQRPKVLTGGMFGGVWDIPATNSYTARLITDAGGEMMVKQEHKSGKITMSLEQVIHYGSDGQVWLHPGQYSSLNDMLKDEPRYKVFNPFIQKQVFNHNARINATGGNDFWESGVIRPDLVLRDLIQILHPVKDSIPNELYYYQRLNE
jgi:iron complex transport system substrate-binding protein